MKSDHHQSVAPHRTPRRTHFLGTLFSQGHQMGGAGRSTIVKTQLQSPGPRTRRARANRDDHLADRTASDLGSECHQSLSPKTDVSTIFALLLSQPY
jgi:hypothetical protein